MRNQKTSTQTGPPHKPVIPVVRYHPSIQIPGGGASSKSPYRARTNQTQKTRPGASQHPLTSTDTEEDQDGSRSSRAVNQKQKPVPHPAAGDRALPTPEQVSLDEGVQLDRDVVEQVEVLTRGQRTNQDWFAWRNNRITASVAHRIAHCRFVNGRSRAPPISYLAAVTGEGPRVQTRAMSWGIQMEAKAVSRYQELKSAMLGRQVQVQDCGLFIDPQRAWLAASPDGIVIDSQSGRRLLCLEVKCPYKHRHRRVEDACRDDPAFCLQIQDQAGQRPGQPPVYRLKTSHSYFTQIQVQLAVTGLQRADLVVFTLQETALVPVSFDADLWEETVSKLELFYRDAILPRIRQKMQKDAAVAGTPEL